MSPDIAKCPLGQNYTRLKITELDEKMLSSINICACPHGLWHCVVNTCFLAVPEAGGGQAEQIGSYWYFIFLLFCK